MYTGNTTPDSGDTEQQLLVKIAALMGSNVSGAETPQQLLLKIAVAAASVSHVTISGFEPVLGNPAADGDVLSSTTAGVRSWVAGFNPARPGPIGGDTPDISTFTGITCGQLSIDHYGNVSSYGVRLDFDNVRAGGWLGTLMTGTGIRFGPNPQLSWGPIDAYDPATMDVNLLRAGVGKLAQSDGPNPQTFILSAKEVNPSNYSRLTLSTVGGVASISIDELGGGIGAMTSLVINATVQIGNVVIDNTLGYFTTPGGVTAQQLITGSGFAIAGGASGITASGNFSNLTIVGGIITNAV